MAGVIQRQSSKLSTVDRLLGNKVQKDSPTGQSVTLRRPSSSSRLRRRHTTDDRPHAYSGKHSLGASSMLKKNQTVESNHSETERRPSIKEALDLGTLQHSVFQKRADGSDTDALACRLALKHRLQLWEVKGIIREFSNVKHTPTGAVEREDFDRAMAQIFDVPKVDPRVSATAYKAVGAATEIDIEKFLEWYVQNMFTQVNAMNADSAKMASDSLIYQIAKRHGVSPIVIDKIKVKFDHYDTDKSGHICFSEFQDMFVLILKAKSIAELNEARINRFWSEVIKASPEGIDFEEFTAWYLKYFGADADDNSCGINEAYYDSFDPTLQRRRSLNPGLLRVTSLPGTL
mmetsp:Transcript_83067/g.158583  ORF Transcript_83067/g.158583 Transcript_83067/m.158583 type:complete len:346 (-) Transcript_83067:83-1120(-)